MKNTHLYLFTILLAGLFCGCASPYPPVCYQQIYHLNGTRTDASEKYSVGNPLPVPEFQTALRQLYARHPEVQKTLPAKDAYRLGWFFNQGEYVRTCGEGIADLCNHAAWFVLHCVKDKQKQAEYALRIAKLMQDFDEEGAMELLSELRSGALPDGMIQEVRKLYDEDNRMEVKSCTEYYSGTWNGKRNPRFGIHREYHKNQMLALDMFYYGGAPLGYAFTYSEDGKLTGVYYYDGTGSRVVRFHAVPGGTK